MKKKLTAVCLIGGAVILCSCNDDKSSYPIPSDIENLKATSAPGQIILNWTNPTDENLYYVQAEYTIEATGKSYKKQVSQYTNELIIDNLLQKYGDINITVQPFNKGYTAGVIHKITARSEKANPTFGTPVKLKLDGKKIWTNAPFAAHPAKDVADGSTATFFHTQWQQKVEMPHYLIVDLGEEASALKFRFTNSPRAADSSWKTVNVYTSDRYDPALWFDGVKLIHGNSVDIAKGGTRKEITFTDLPAGAGKVYNSDIIPLSKPSRFLWFETTETTSGTAFFTLAELEIYACSMIIPE